MEEEPSELERLCLEVRAQLEALADEDDDGDASSTDTDEECIMAADHYHQEASHESAAETMLGGAAANDGQEYASSSRMSSGTLYTGSGSYEMSFLAGARPSGNIMNEISRCDCHTSHTLSLSGQPMRSASRSVVNIRCKSDWACLQMMLLERKACQV